MTSYHWLPKVDALVLRGDRGTASVVASTKQGTTTYVLRESSSSRKRATTSFPWPNQAIEEALARGYVGTVEETGTLLVQSEIGMSAHAAFAVDELRACAWLGDAGYLRRVDLTDGALRSVAIAQRPIVRDVIADGAGGAWALVEDDDGRKTRYIVIHCDGVRITYHSAVDESAHTPVCPCISRADDGSMLVPHDDGFALLGARGAVIRTWKVGGTSTWGPRAALARNGAWLAYTVAARKLAVVDVKRGVERIHQGTFEDVMALEVHGDGVVDLSTGSPAWEFQRFALTGLAARTSHRASAYATSPDRRWVYSCAQAWEATDLEQGTRWTGAKVGAAKGAAVTVTEAHLYARTVGGVFQRFARALRGER